MIEPTTGVVVIDGERYQLTPKQYTLFAELAKSPGQAVSPESILERLWPGIPGMTSQDVYTNVYRLRKRIGDTRRNPPLITRRHGFGYVIDRKPGQVSMLGGPVSGADDSPDVSTEVSREEPRDDLDPQAPEAERPVSLQHLTPITTDASGFDDEKPVPIGLLQAGASSGARGKREVPRSALVAVVSGLAVLAIIAGALLSRAFGDPERAESPPPDPPVAREQLQDAKPRPEVRGRRQHRKTPNKKSRRGKRPGRDGQVFVATAPVGGGSVTSGGSSVGSESSQAAAEPKRDPKPAPPPLPPAPSSFLYHLFNPETGDHFVTVNPGVASEYEGRGYNSAAIGRVYTYAEKGTKAITTNSGTAYVFAGAAAKTSPRSSAVALWYASDGSGDFFYTTSKGEASKDGWSASVIGYVRSP